MQRDQRRVVAHHEAGLREAPHEVDVLGDPPARVESAGRAQVRDPADQAGRGQVGHGGAGAHLPSDGAEVEGGGGGVVPLEPAGVLRGDAPGDPGSGEGQLRVGDVPREVEEDGGADDDVGVDEGDERRRHPLQSGVPRSGGARVGGEGQHLRAVPDRDGRDGGGVVRGVVDDQRPQRRQRRQTAVELGGAVADGYDDGEVRCVDGDVAQDGVGEVAVEETTGERGGGGVGDAQPVAGQEGAGSPGEPQGPGGCPADEQAAAVTAGDVVAQPDLEALRQGGGHGENPPSACTRPPLRTAASGPQQKARVAAISSGSRRRRSSWLSANPSVPSSS